jgi:Ni/Co efflux regulator RcnB
MKTLIIAAATLSLLGGAAAQAQTHYDRHDDHSYDRHDSRSYDRHDDRSYDRDRRDGHRWARGQRLPRTYWGGHYVVSDWRARHLRPPPRGYHWVRVNNDYVLAAVATGLIADIIANSR